KDQYRMRLFSRKRADAEVTEVEREINELVQELGHVRARIRASNPGYAALTQPAPLSLPEIQRLLDNETVLLEYLVGRSRSYLCLVTSDSISSYQLPPAQKIDQVARRVYELLASPTQSTQGATLKEMHAWQTKRKAEFNQAAAELSRIIVGPVSSKLG